MRSRQDETWDTATHCNTLRHTATHSFDMSSWKDETWDSQLIWKSESWMVYDYRLLQIIGLFAKKPYKRDDKIGIMNGPRQNFFGKPYFIFFVVSNFTIWLQQDLLKMFGAILHWAGSICKWSPVSFAEYRLFYRASLQKRLIILRSL